MTNRYWLLLLLLPASCTPPAECADLVKFKAHLNSGRCVVDGDLTIEGSVEGAARQSPRARGHADQGH